MNHSSRRAWLKGAVGVIAAYAFALQMLLGAIVVTQMAVADPAAPFTICYGVHTPDNAPDGGTSPRINHATCMLCAAPMAPPPLLAAQAPAIDRVATAVPYRPAHLPHAGPQHRHEPRTSRGPPQTA